jgi:pyruvate dehydrogenase E1 component beta subunit
MIQFWICKENQQIGNFGRSLAICFCSFKITYMVQQKAFDYLDAPIKRITTPDAPAPYSAALFAEWFPKLEKVKEEIKKAMYVKA